MKENGKTTQIVLPVKELNAYLCCKLCNGYFREAHSISECLHTFCKGCILNHLENQPRGNKKCPICSVELKPHRLIYDRTIQAVVDKLFPHFIYNQHTAATSSMQTASSSSHLNSSSTGAGAGASVQAGGKRARDESAADADEQEEDIAKSDANLAIIRVMPYPISSESDALSSSSSSNELARKQLPPLSKPLLKAVDSVKVHTEKQCQMIHLAIVYS